MTTNPGSKASLFSLSKTNSQFTARCNSSDGQNTCGDKYRSIAGKVSSYRELSLGRK